MSKKRTWDDGAYLKVDAIDCFTGKCGNHSVNECEAVSLAVVQKRQNREFLCLCLGTTEKDKYTNKDDSHRVPETQRVKSMEPKKVTSRPCAFKSSSTLTKLMANKHKEKAGTEWGCGSTKTSRQRALVQAVQGSPSEIGLAAVLKTRSP